MKKDMHEVNVNEKEVAKKEKKEDLVDEIIRWNRHIMFIREMSKH